MNLTVADGFPYYIALVESASLKDLFHSIENLKLLSSISEQKAGFRYAPGKWSIKQLVGHINDHERIMTYRALRFSRKDTTPLPGYDQNLFVENSRFDEIRFEELLQDFKNVRQATISLMHSFSPEQLQLRGLAWKFELTVEEVLKATIGHEIHHMNILRERYLS